MNRFVKVLLRFTLFSCAHAAWLARLLAISSLIASAVIPASAESRLALVIGNDHYNQLDAHHPLQKAINDANAVGDALEHDGFKVLRGADLTRAQMVDKLFELTSLLQPGDIVAFFFAGHGVSLDTGNYILPTDVPNAGPGQEMRIASQSLAEADVIASLRDKGARVAVVILDACRDNPFKQAGARGVGLSRGLARMPEAEGVFSLYSAGFGQSALDRLDEEDNNQNSVFTRVLLPLLTTPGLNLQDLGYTVRDQVAALARTAPDHHQQTPAFYDEIIGGRVYLAGEAATQPPAPAYIAKADPRILPADSTTRPASSTATAAFESPTFTATPNVPPSPASPDGAEDRALEKRALGRAALLVDAPDTAEKIKTYVGTVVWTTAQPSQKSPVAGTVQAEIAVPSAGMTMKMSLQKTWRSSSPPATL